MTTYMLDTMVIDAIADDWDFVTALRGTSESGVGLLVTHIQVDEVLATPDAAKRDRLVRALLWIGVRMVLTRGAYLDHSRLGMCTCTPEEAGARMKGFQRGNRQHIEDALIAETALHVGAVLITGEVRLRPWREHYPQLELLSIESFRAMVMAVP
jgi:hypothetical protein